MSKWILIVLGILTMFNVALMFEPEQRTTIKLSDVKFGKDRESLEHYLYQGFWAKRYVWSPRWIKTWQEKKVYVPMWKRVWRPVKVKEWVTVHASPPTWVKNVPGEFSVKLPQ